MERSWDCFSYVFELTSLSLQTLSSIVERNGKRVNVKLGFCSNITSWGSLREVATMMFIQAVISVRMRILFFSLLLKVLFVLFRSVYMHLICTHRFYRKHIQVSFAFASKLHSQPFLPWPSVLAQPCLNGWLCVQVATSCPALGYCDLVLDCLCWLQLSHCRALFLMFSHSSKHQGSKT